MFFDFSNARELGVSLYFEINIDSLHLNPSQLDASEFCEKHLGGDHIVTNHYDDRAKLTNVWEFNGSIDTSANLTNQLYPNPHNQWTICLSNTNFEDVLKNLLEDERVIKFMNTFESVYGDHTITPRIGIIFPT